MVNTFVDGIGYGEVALTVARVGIGVFFAISGYHKLFNTSRHIALVETLKENKIPFIAFNQWWVPSVEFFGGLALVAGALTPLAALGLLVLCAVATCTDGIKRIQAYKPIDKADWLDDLLYLPEVLYAAILFYFVCEGAGPYSLDEWVLWALFY